MGKMGIECFFWSKCEQSERSKWAKTSIRENERELWEEEIVLLELIQAI